VFYALRAGDQRCVEDGAVELFHRRLAFLDDANDAVAFLAARLLADDPEDLFEPRDLLLRLPQVISKGGPELRVLRGFRHFRERLRETILAVIRVAEFFDEQFL
jgi:hypothetical protein